MASDRKKEAIASAGTPTGPAGWMALGVLAGFLGWAIWYAIHAWNLLAGVGISTVGWLFLVLGVIVTIIVGAGLMALLFYSSRNGKDSDPALPEIRQAAPAQEEQKVFTAMDTKSTKKKPVARLRARKSSS